MVHACRNTLCCLPCYTSITQQKWESKDCSKVAQSERYCIALNPWFSALSFRWCTCCISIQTEEVSGNVNWHIHQVWRMSCRLLRGAGSGKMREQCDSTKIQPGHMSRSLNELALKFVNLKDLRIYSEQFFHSSSLSICLGASFYGPSFITSLSPCVWSRPL